MRSAAEVRFRAEQEVANLLLLILPPSFHGEAPPQQLALPDGREVAEALRGSEYARDVERLAESVLAHRFPIFGAEIDVGREIQWRRDYVHGKESGTAYLRRIPYLNFDAVGDHKYVWELNRHQHLVLLGQAFLLTGRQEFAREILSELESWLEQNPPQRGINWTSALEVAFRLLSWIWVYHLIAAEMTEAFRGRFLTALRQHGRHLERNLSVYFSPNTHLLGEAVALHALGKLFDTLPESRRWVKRGEEIVRGQLAFQVREDGSHFEQSTYYHVYAVDLFLLFYLLAGRPAEFRPSLERMAEYLFWLLGPARRIAFLGDDDGGRLFHPYGDRDQFGRATLSTCGILFGREEWIGTSPDVAEQAVWWLGAEVFGRARQQVNVPHGARLFRDSGMAFLEAGELFLQMDCGPFGWAGAGHSHSDSLSVLLSVAGERVLVDPGTYTYIGDPAERDWFRGSSAHNTVRIDGLNQGRGAGPFRWASKPEVELTSWEPKEDGGLIEAVCRYEGFEHYRRVALDRGRLVIRDRIEGGTGEHVAEQVWQLGPGASKVNFTFSAEVTRSASKVSGAYGTQEAGEALTARVKGRFPQEIAVVIEAGGNGSVVTDESCLRAVLPGVSCV